MLVVLVKFRNTIDNLSQVPNGKQVSINRSLVEKHHIHSSKETWIAIDKRLLTV